MAFWGYMLQGAEGSSDVGHSDNLAERLAQHQSGALGGYTTHRRPVHLGYAQEFPARDEAFAAEQQLQGWTRKKKAALILGDWGELRRLARGRQRASAYPSTGSG